MESENGWKQHVQGPGGRPHPRHLASWISQKGVGGETASACLSSSTWLCAWAVVFHVAAAPGQTICIASKELSTWCRTQLVVSSFPANKVKDAGYITPQAGEVRVTGLASGQQEPRGQCVRGGWGWMRSSTASAGPPFPGCAFSPPFKSHHASDLQCLFQSKGTRLGSGNHRRKYQKY